MQAGIRATVEFTTPDICPIVECSASAEATIDRVTTNVCPADCTRCVTEFAVDDEGDPHPDHEAIEPVFSHGSANRYRYRHGDDVSCPCECLGQFACPVDRYVAREGTLTLVFHVPDYEELREVVATVREQFPGVDIKRLVRSTTADRTRDDILVDRSKLTARQLEVLETAHEMGYFERPRRANATAVADALDIDQSTFSEHLAVAQSKLFADLLEEGG